MPNTPNMGLPYPGPLEGPDGPGAIAALANKLDKLGAAWTPSIDGVASSNEAAGWAMRVGGFCLAYGFLRAADGDYPASSSNYLNLPMPSLGVAGIPYSIGEVDITKRGGALGLGRIMQSGAGATGSKAWLYVDNTGGTGGGVTSNLFTAAAPLNVGASDALYFNFRLRYWVGV